MRWIGVLYDIKRDVNGLPPERRRTIRAERTTPLLAEKRHDTSLTIAMTRCCCALRGDAKCAACITKPPPQPMSSHKPRALTLFARDP